MTKTIYLHVGFHKTGTSSIQHYLNENRVFLKHQGLLYPTSVIRGDNQSILANSLKGIYRNKDLVDSHYDRVNKEILRHQGNTIISSECFMEGVDPAAVKAVLGNPGDVVKILFYVRPQIQWIESLFGEVIKDSSRRYTGYIGSLREIRLGKLDYYAELKKWLDVFGDKNVIVREFKKWSSKTGLIDDFLEAIEFHATKPRSDKAKNSIKNPAYDRRCIEFLRRTNLVAMPRDMHIQMVSELGKFSEVINQQMGKTSFKCIIRSEAEKLEIDWNRNIGSPNASLLGPGKALPFNNEPINTFPSERKSLTAQEEHWIFDHLPNDIQNHLEKMSPTIRSRQPDKAFIPITPQSEEARLRAIIARMRAELNWIYH